MTVHVENLLAVVEALAKREEESMTIQERSRKWGENRKYWNKKIGEAYDDILRRRKEREENYRPDI